MSGVRLGGQSFVTSNSLPYVILEEGEVDGNYNVWRVLDGVPTRITPWGPSSSLPGGGSGPWSEPMENPRLSPDGTLVAYSTYWASSGYGVIQLVDALGGVSVVDLTPDNGPGSEGAYRLHPSWNALSTKVVFTRSISGGFSGDVYEAVVASPGSETMLWEAERQTPTQREGAYRPHYSPDGTKIAFLVTIEAGGGGTPSRQGLWVMDADGSNDSLIRSFAVGSNTEMGYAYAGTQIAWSNDGEWIAFDTRAWGSGEQEGVYKIRPDGSDEMLLAEGYPAVSFTEFLLGHGAWTADDSALILSLNSSTSSGWTVVSTPTDGSEVHTELVADGFGPTASQYFERAYRNPQDNRIYFIWRSPGVLRSCAIDGSDERSDHEIADAPASSSLFFNGTGIEWI